MARYRKKPIVIDAFQMTKAIWGTNEGWPQWAREAWDIDTAEVALGAIWVEGSKVYCGTLEGPHEITFDDWIIRGVEGEIYPCKPSVFEATYEPE